MGDLTSIPTAPFRAMCETCTFGSRPSNNYPHHGYGRADALLAPLSSNGSLASPAADKFTRFSSGFLVVVMAFFHTPTGVISGTHP